MSESYPFFAFKDNEWVSCFGDLVDDISSPEIEFSATIIFYDHSRPMQLVDFLKNKFGLEGPFKFLGHLPQDPSNQSKSSKLKAISEDLKKKSNTSDGSGTRRARPSD